MASPPEEGGRASRVRTDPAHPAHAPRKGLNSNDFTSPQHLSSRQAAWWPVREFVEAVVAQANVGPLPVAGTPAWLVLADDDPRKLLAVAIAGEHHVLRMETAQQALADASREVSGSADWTQVARESHSRNTFRANKPWAKRVAS